MADGRQLGWAADRNPTSVPTTAAVKTPANILLPPPVPITKSPVDSLRQLLAMTPAEREQFLAAKTDEQKKFIFARLREYDALIPPERERRLRLVQLHWYLAPLLRLPPAERGELLATVPDADRPIITDRLMQWDKLPPAVQQEVLANERIGHYSLRLSTSTPAQLKDAFAALTLEQRRKLDADLNQWRRLPAERREKMQSYFEKFFDLPPKEKEKTLNLLSETERQQMEKTLQAFATLPREQRRLCIESFDKLARLTPPERNQFLKNADTWQMMTPRERQTWRILVTQLPPLPPSYGEIPMPPPPPAVPGGTQLSSTNTSK